MIHALFNYFKPSFQLLSLREFFFAFFAETFTVAWREFKHFFKRMWWFVIPLQIIIPFLDIFVFEDSFLQRVSDNSALLLSSPVLFFCRLFKDLQQWAAYSKSAFLSRHGGFLLEFTILFAVLLYLRKNDDNNSRVFAWEYWKSYFLPVYALSTFVENFLYFRILWVVPFLFFLDSDQSLALIFTSIKNGFKLNLRFSFLLIGMFVYLDLFVLISLVLELLLIFGLSHLRACLIYLFDHVQHTFFLSPYEKPIILELFVLLLFFIASYTFFIFFYCTFVVRLYTTIRYRFDAFFVYDNQRNSDLSS